MKAHSTGRAWEDEQGGQRKVCSKTKGALPSKELALGINIFRRLIWVSKWVDFSRGAEAGKAGGMATLCKNSGLGGVKKHHKGSAGPLGPTAIGKTRREKPEHMEEGVCAGIIQQCHLPLQGGDCFEGEGLREPLTPPSRAIPVQTHTHTHTGKAHTWLRGSRWTCLPAGRLPPFPAGRGDAGARAMVVDN